MIATKLSQVKQYAFYLSSNKPIDNNKVEVFHTQTMKNFSNIEYELMRFGFIKPTRVV